MPHNSDESLARRSQFLAFRGTQLVTISTASVMCSPVLLPRNLPPRSLPPPRREQFSEFIHGKSARSSKEGRCNSAVALRRVRAMFTAQEPEGVGPEKYDETAAVMIAQLKYGSGIPFYRLEQLEGQLGIPCRWQRSGRSWQRLRSCLNRRAMS